MADDPTTEQSQPDSFEGEEPEESTSGAVGGKPGRKPAAAYRDLQSRLDQEKTRSAQLEQRLQAVESYAQTAQRQQQEAEFYRNVQQLPEEQQIQAVSNYRWQQLQQALAAEQAARQQAEGFVAQSGAMARASELVAEHYLPPKVYGVPTIRFLLASSRTIEEMEARAAQMAEDLGGTPPATRGKASGPAPRRGSRYAGGEGSSAPRVPITQRSQDEMDKIWNDLKAGRIKERNLGRI